MRQKRTFVTIAAIGFAFLLMDSCSKYEDGPAVSLRSKQNRLVGEWKLTNVAILQANGIESTLIFEKNGDFAWTETSETGYTKIEGNEVVVDTTWSERSVEPGTWKWIDNKNGLEIATAIGVTAFDIQKLTNSEFELSSEGQILKMEKL